MSNIIALLNNRMPLTGMDTNMTSCVEGVVLLIAIGSDSVQQVCSKKA